MFEQQRGAAIGFALWMIVAGAAPGICAGAAPSLVVVAHQERVRAGGVAPLPLWDTTWWVSVATSDDSRICRLNYNARFADGTDTRPLVGSFDLGARSTTERGGRIAIRCAARLDYDRRLRVRLQAEACDGAMSEWTESEFPVRDVAEAPAAKNVEPGTAAAEPAIVDVLTTDAGAATTLGEVRAALDRAARSRGASEATNLRIVEARGDRVRFAADAVRAPAAPPQQTASPVPQSASEVLLGDIVMPAPRR